jgi:hypothetical protein
MARSVLVSCLAFAGVWVLAGPGWALVAGALLVFALWPQGAETELARAGRRASALARRAMAAPRRAVAMVTASSGLAVLPVGLALATGIGTAVAVGGGLLIAAGLLTGWNA